MPFTIHIAALPIWLSALLIVALPTVIFMCGPAVVRRLYGIENVVGNNEVAGFKFATLGVVYAVILGLAVIACWEKYAEAEGAATAEAGSVAAMYRLSGGLPAEAQAPLRQSLDAYVQAVIESDWPAMASGGESQDARRALDSVYAATLALPAADGRSETLLADMLERLDSITEARRVRIALAEGVVPGVVWLILGIGAALTLAFTFFFGLENLKAQVAMTGMLALIIFLALFVAISINHPFTGSVRVAPKALEIVLSELGQAQPP